MVTATTALIKVNKKSITITTNNNNNSNNNNVAGVSPEETVLSGKGGPRKNTLQKSSQKTVGDAVQGRTLLPGVSMGIGGGGGGGNGVGDDNISIASERRSHGHGSIYSLGMYWDEEKARLHEKNQSQEAMALQQLQQEQQQIERAKRLKIWQVRCGWLYECVHYM